MRGAARRKKSRVSFPFRKGSEKLNISVSKTGNGECDLSWQKVSIIHKQETGFSSLYGCVPSTPSVVDTGHSDKGTGNKHLNSCKINEQFYFINEWLQEPLMSALAAKKSLRLCDLIYSIKRQLLCYFLMVII